MDDDAEMTRRAKAFGGEPLSPELRARIIEKFRKLVGGYVRSGDWQPAEASRDNHDEWRELQDKC